MARDTQERQDVARTVFSLMADIKRLQGFDPNLVKAEMPDIILANNALSRLTAKLS